MDIMTVCAIMAGIMMLCALSIGAGARAQSELDRAAGIRPVSARKLRGYRFDAGHWGDDQYTAGE